MMHKVFIIMWWLLYIYSNQSPLHCLYTLFTHIIFNCILSTWSFKTYSQNANEDKIVGLIWNLNIFVVYMTDCVISLNSIFQVI